LSFLRGHRWRHCSRARLAPIRETAAAQRSHPLHHFDGALLTAWAAVQVALECVQSQLCPTFITGIRSAEPVVHGSLAEALEYE